MKKQILGLGILAVWIVSSVATAKDCVYQEEYGAFSCDSCCCNAGFQDFYIGGNLGAIARNVYHDTDAGGSPFSDPYGNAFYVRGFTIGLRTGYDWYFPNSLFGFVVDWNRSTSLDRTYTSVNEHETYKLKLDWYMTIRGRCGISFCNSLFYLTAGAAVAHTNTIWNTYFLGPYEILTTRWGWTGGIGTEYPLGKKWSLGVDILYMHFANKFVERDQNVFNSSDSILVGRAILNFHFGNPFNFFCNKTR